MNPYAIAVIYILIGILGALFHYLKKRYIDNTLTCSLKDYLLTNKKATAKAVFTIISAEVGLALASESFLSLAELVAVLTSGYTADSVLNSTEL